MALSRAQQRTVLGGAAAATLLIAFISPVSRAGDLVITHDGGTCIVDEKATPSVGSGCHAHWQEISADGGEWVDVIAPLRCGTSIEVCGRAVWCRCPRR